jgi:hypothetical protein
MLNKVISFLLLLISNCSLVFGQTSAHTGTYSNGHTLYYVNETYKTTGKPLVKRSEAAKLSFLKSLKLKSLPAGYEIDHIKPLSQGGEDIKENMQLLTIGQHKIKTAIERGEVAKINHGELSFTSFFESDDKPIGIRDLNDWENQKDISPKDIDRELNSKRVLFKGPKGGTYYLSAGGKKVYQKASIQQKSTEETSPLYSITPKTTKETNVASSQRQYFTGPKGGTYYVNDKGKKVYGKPPADASASLPSVTKARVIAPASVPVQSTSNQSREILTGSRGGQYYMNSRGNKTYIKK